MLRNYIKIAWRNIWRNKAFSLTNLLGLTIGMSCTLLILLWVQDELSWDKFHPNHKEVYHIMANREFNGEVNTDIATPFPLSDALRQNFPEIRNTAMDDYGGDHVIKLGDKLVKKRGYFTNPDYFKIFRWTFVKGNAATALSRPENMVITESAATALFGSEDPIGKVVLMDNHANHTISAVVQNPPSNSTIQFDFITPFDYSSDQARQSGSDWVNSFTKAYVEVQPGTDVDLLGKKITAFMHSRTNNTRTSYFLHPMAKWRLYGEFKDGKNTGGMIAYVKLFTIIALIILVIACVNFMNLSTAKSEKRAREVGIRKTLGSARGQLIGQFYSESLIFSLLAFLFSVLAVFVLLPSFNGLVGKQLSLNFLDPIFLVLAISMIGFTGLIAGSYPAIYLSSFNPVRVLKGTFLPGKTAALPRKVLVVLQFGISVLLISSTILVYRQMQHVKQRDLGYNPDNLISIPSTYEANQNAIAIRNDLVRSGLISSVTRTSSPVTEIWNFTPAPEFKGRPENTDVLMTAMRTDIDFTKTIGTTIINGRDFTNTPGDSNVMLLNRAAVEVLQLKDPIGMELRHGPRTYNVVGVTENLVMGSPFSPVMPMMVMLDKERGNFFVVRLKDGVAPQKAIPLLESVFKQYNPGSPFEYSFVDQQFSRKFVTEDLIEKLTQIFAGLAIFICCLGLWGLTSFTIERRFKEIGIRKVLGASVRQVLFLISKEFLLLVLIAAIVSIPVTWWILNNWLRNYEYRVSLDFWLFAGSCTGVLALTLFVVCLNSMRAAGSNPVRHLRTE